MHHLLQKQCEAGSHSIASRSSSGRMLLSAYHNQSLPVSGKAPQTYSRVTLSESSRPPSPILSSASSWVCRVSMTVCRSDT